jgi:hypothetical protein
MSVTAKVNWCFVIAYIEPPAKVRSVREAAFGGNSRHRFGRVDQ